MLGQLVSFLNRSKVGTIPLSVYYDLKKKKNCSNETINVPEGSVNEIGENMG